MEAFHLDEYAGMPMTHPASFRLWLKTRLADRVPLRAMHYLNGDAPDLEAECRRYGALLAEAPIDAGFIGIGENGHIAFNDPAVADFADPAGGEDRSTRRCLPAAAGGRGPFREHRRRSGACVVVDVSHHHGDDEPHLLCSGAAQGESGAGYDRRPDFHELSCVDPKNAPERAAVSGCGIRLTVGG